MQPYSGVFPELERIVGFFRLMETLDPEEPLVRATTTGLTADMLIRPHLEANRELYDAHFGRNPNEEA
jgi:hypothetical protein